MLNLIWYVISLNIQCISIKSDQNEIIPIKIWDIPPRFLTNTSDKQCYHHHWSQESFFISIRNYPEAYMLILYANLYVISQINMHAEIPEIQP